MSKLLTKHLELVSTSKDGVRRLRQLILDLAVQGKLVPQDPNDEPAKDWLAGLQKVASIGEIDLNTSLPLPKPPDGWMWCFLQEISNINMGQSPDGKSYNVSGEGTPLINGPVEFSKSPYGTTIKSKWTTEPTKLCKTGDLLICVRGATTGRTNIAGFDACIGRGVASIRPVIDFSYFHHFVVANARSFLSLGTGTTFPSISKKQIESFPICIPPLEEQKRIVAKVDELMALCDRLEAQQTDAGEAHKQLVDVLLDALIQSKDQSEFLDSWHRIKDNFDILFTTEYSVDALKQTILQLAVMGKLSQKKNSGRLFNEKWERTKLGKIADLQNGYAFKSDWFKTEGPRLVRNANMGHGSLHWDDTKRLDPDRADEYTRFSLEEGDVLISLDRPIISTGLKYATVNKNDLPCMLLQRVARFLVDKRSLDTAYLCYWLNSKEFIDSIDPGRSNGVPHISTKHLCDLAFYLPPLEEQKRIVAKVDELMALCDELKNQIKQGSELQNLTASTLLSKAVQSEATEMQETQLALTSS